MSTGIYIYFRFIGYYFNFSTFTCMPQAKDKYLKVCFTAISIKKMDLDNVSVPFIFIRDLYLAVQSYLNSCCSQY